MMSDEATSLLGFAFESGAKGGGWSVMDGQSEQEAELVRRFAARLVVVAERNLAPYLRHKVEPEDITQSVFRTFFRRQRLGEFEFQNWNGVWGLLVRLAVCKCRNRVTYLEAQCRDVRQECSLDFLKENKEDIHALLFEPQDTQPLPDEQTEIGEVLERFFEELSENDRMILAGHLAGYRSPDISVQVGSSEQTVRRRLQQMERKLWTHLNCLESVEFECIAL